MTKNEMIKFGRRWFIRNVFVRLEGRYKPWLMHKHKGYTCETIVFQHSIICDKCNKEAPPLAKTMFRMILDGWERNCK